MGSHFLILKDSEREKIFKEASIAILAKQQHKTTYREAILKRLGQRSLTSIEYF